MSIFSSDQEGIFQVILPVTSTSSALVHTGNNPGSHQLDKGTLTDMLQKNKTWDPAANRMSVQRVRNMVI